MSCVKNRMGRVSVTRVSATILPSEQFEYNCVMQEHSTATTVNKLYTGVQAAFKLQLNFPRNMAEQTSKQFYSTSVQVSDWAIL